MDTKRPFLLVGGLTVFALLSASLTAVLINNHNKSETLLQNELKKAELQKNELEKAEASKLLSDPQDRAISVKNAEDLWESAIGEWGDVKSEYRGYFNITISEVKNQTAKLIVESVQAPPASRIASFETTIDFDLDGKGTFTFDDDGFFHEGKGKISIDNDELIFIITESHLIKGQKEHPSGWGIFEMNDRVARISDITRKKAEKLDAQVKEEQNPELIIVNKFKNDFNSRVISKLQLGAFTKNESIPGAYNTTFSDNLVFTIILTNNKIDSISITQYQGNLSDDFQAMMRPMINYMDTSDPLKMVLEGLSKNEKSVFESVELSTIQIGRNLYILNWNKDVNSYIFLIQRKDNENKQEQTFTTGKKITVGMSKEQVVGILGKPIDAQSVINDQGFVKSMGNDEWWYYPNNLVLHFQNDKLYSFNK